MNDDSIISQLRLLKKYVSLLKTISTKSEQEFMKDDIIKGAAQRYLQLAIESCINIGNKIISLQQLQKDLKAPDTYSEIFMILGDLNVLPRAFVDKLVSMARFRNRLVHMYWEIDDHMIWEILNDNLDDFEEFAEYIKKYLLER